MGVDLYLEVPFYISVRTRKIINQVVQYAMALEHAYKRQDCSRVFNAVQKFVDLSVVFYLYCAQRKMK